MLLPRLKVNLRPRAHAHTHAHIHVRAGEIVSTSFFFLLKSSAGKCQSSFLCFSSKARVEGGSRIVVVVVRGFSMCLSEELEVPSALSLECFTGV